MPIFLLTLMQNKHFAKLSLSLLCFIVISMNLNTINIMLIRAHECYKWLPLFSVPTSALWISSSYYITAYIENFVHNNECYGDGMQ